MRTISFHNNPLYLLKTVFFSSRKWKNSPRYKALHGRFKINIIIGHWNVEPAMLLSTLIEVLWYYLLPAKTSSMLGNLIKHGSHGAWILDVIACTGNSSTMSLCITILGRRFLWAFWKLQVQYFSPPGWRRKRFNYGGILLSPDSCTSFPILKVHSHLVLGTLVLSPLTSC